MPPSMRSLLLIIEAGFMSTTPGKAASLAHAMEIAALERGVSLDLDAWSRPDQIVINYVENSTGPKGTAAAILLDLTRRCDQSGITLKLSVLGNSSKLMDYYARLGFVLSDPGSGSWEEGDNEVEEATMTRKPRRSRSKLRVSRPIQPAT